MDNDLVAGSFESSHEVLLDGLCLEAFEVVGSQFLIALFALQQMVGDGEHGVCDRDQGALSAQSLGEAAELSRKVGLA